MTRQGGPTIKSYYDQTIGNIDSPLRMADRSIQGFFSSQFTEAEVPAFNVARLRVRPGREADFQIGFQNAPLNWPGLLSASLIQTGESTFCLIGEWTEASAIADAHDTMMATVDTFRHTLEPGRIRDHVFGPVVLALK